MAHTLKQLLGIGYERFVKNAEGKTYQGHVSSDPLQFNVAVSRVLKNREVARKLGVRYFAGRVSGASCAEPAGSGVRLYAIRDASEADVADLADVGVLSEPGVNTPESVRAIIEIDPDGPFAQMVRSGRLSVEQLADPDPRAARAKMREFFRAAYARCPYEIYYADRKGCRARFLKQIAARDALWLERKIMRVDPEAMDVVKTGTIRSDIARNGEMRLWWD